ncbi:MAG TPA: sensor histidine kinase N-terminal domain-containing protein, partial [Kofleriaceae bacterium]|nr:sensor histidine kinase N-terminal domain-containing protein [Kofleriaceae bacterium]
MSGPSLRRRLTAWVLVLVAAALAALALVLFSGVSRAVRAQHDRELLGRARAMAALVEYDEDGYEMELTGIEAPGVQRADRPFYFQAWLPDRTVLARSRSLAGGDLPDQAGSVDDPYFADRELPDGRAGRLVGIGFTPRSEDAEPPAGTVILVLADDTADVDATVRDIRTLFLVVGGLALLAVALTTALIVRRGLRPLAALAGDLERIDEHSLAARLPVDGQPAELVTPVAK